MMANILKYWDNGVLKSVTTGGSNGGTSDHSQLTNRDIPDQHPMSAITGLNDALDSKQPSGDYATKTELTDGLSGKQDAGDYATNTGLAEKQNKTKIVNVTMTTETEGTSDVPDSQILKWIREGDAVKALVFYNGKLVMELNDCGQDTFGFYFKKENVEENTINVHYVYIYGVQVKTRIEYFSPYADTVVSEIPPELPPETEPNVQAVLNVLSADKLSKTGHTPNKNLVTDASGNVVEEEKATIPTKLPNPNSITFTGGATGSYDGSSAVIIDIPQGGTGGPLKPLTFTGAVSAEYDGTKPVAVEIPAGGGGGTVVAEKLNPEFPLDSNYSIENTIWDGPNFFRYGRIVQAQFSFRVNNPDNSKYHAIVKGLPGYMGPDRVVASVLARDGSGPVRLQLTSTGTINAAGGERGGSSSALRIYDCCFCYVCKE